MSNGTYRKGREMVTITINGEKKQYPQGMIYEEIAKEYQPSYKDMIALVIENGKISNLLSHPDDNERMTSK